MRLAWVQSGLGDRVDVLRGRAEQRHPRFVGEGEQRIAVGMERRSVVEKDRGAGREHVTSQFHIIQPRVVK